MNIITLKYPGGEFTQAELAAANGMEKIAVYLPLREAIKNGTLVKKGTRPQPSGRGKPTNLYWFTGNDAPVPSPAPLPPQPIVEAPPMPSTPPVVNLEPNLPDAVILAKELDTAIREHRPPEPIPQPVVMSAPNPSYPCPLCHGPMTEIPDATGVMIKCFNVPCDPQCNENPFGHGSKAKDAYEIAKQKFYAK